MPQTFRDYPVREVALSVEDKATLLSGHERKQEGDIVAIRKPHSGIGSGIESTHHLWLRIQGPDANDMTYDQVLIENADQHGDGPIFDKKQHCIPLDRLKVVCPWLDLTRVRDTTDAYQPFLPFDEDDHSYLPGLERGVLEVEGLVLNKAIMDYV